MERTVKLKYSDILYFAELNTVIGCKQDILLAFQKRTNPLVILYKPLWIQYSEVVLMIEMSWVYLCRRACSRKLLNRHIQRFICIFKSQYLLLWKNGSFWPIRNIAAVSRKLKNNTVRKTAAKPNRLALYIKKCAISKFAHSTYRQLLTILKLRQVIVGKGEVLCQHYNMNS